METWTRIYIKHSLRVYTLLCFSVRLLSYRAINYDDGVLTYLYSTLLENKPDGFTIYADIEGAKVNGGTIPPEIMVTSSRPDIVIINRNTSPSSVLLVELTVPFSKNIEAANARKRARYEFLKSDITEAGFSCSNIPLEVCSRGQITSRNRETLLFLCHTFGIRKFQQVIRNCSKFPLLGSYAIYLARNGSDWSGSGLLTPWTNLFIYLILSLQV